MLPCHMHAIPVKVDLEDRLVSDGLFSIKLEAPSAMFEKCYELGQYLYFEDFNQEESLFQITRPIPRQYLRTITAEAIGRPELANWHDNPNWEQVNADRDKLKEVFKNEKIS
ncbi:hypothetical protein [Lactobacillus bombicola]|uniref:hypothetical protein n=1 Tax=Lactobacillus bombicola TaxID=1505723 RepID=UPI001D171CBC|nr:hypothetical protein [Lactobacillus bombicola]